MAQWGDDPVHLTPLGYTALAESLIATTNSETEPLKVREAPQKDTAKRREGISRSDWTASRWGPHNKTNHPDNYRATAASSSSSTPRSSGSTHKPSTSASSNSRPVKKPRW